MVNLNKEASLQRFDCFLFSLDQQKTRLRKLNSGCYENVPDHWFENLDTTTDHTQSLRDLEFFFISYGGNFRDNLRYQLALLTQSQGIACKMSDFDIDDVSIYHKIDASVYLNPGIHRIRIDMLSNWNPIFGLSADNLRQDGRSMDGVLALGAYASQDPGLFAAIDGSHLPFVMLGEVQTGEDHAHVPCLFNTSYDIHVTTRHCEDVSTIFAVPSRVV